MINLDLTHRHHIKSAICHQVLQKPVSEQHVKKDKRTKVLYPVGLACLPETWDVGNILVGYVNDNLDVDVGLTLLSVLNVWDVVVVQSCVSVLVVRKDKRGHVCAH